MTSFYIKYDERVDELFTVRYMSVFNNIYTTIHHPKIVILSWFYMEFGDDKEKMKEISKFLDFIKENQGKEYLSSSMI
jgi:elongation factor P--beta-lysine ligase